MPSGCTIARRARWIHSAGKSWATCASTTHWPRHPSTCSGIRASRSVPTAWCTGYVRFCFISCPPSSWISCCGSQGPNLCTYTIKIYVYVRTFMGEKFPKGRISNKNKVRWIYLSPLEHNIHEYAIVIENNARSRGIPVKFKFNFCWIGDKLINHNVLWYIKLVSRNYLDTQSG